MHAVFRLGVSAGLAWFVWSILDRLFFINDPRGLEKLSQWGGSFGGLSALISAMGFLTVIWSINKQQGDQHRQRFHGQYIELLKLLREVRGDVNFEHSASYLSSKGGKAQVYTGVMAFQHAWREVSIFIKEDDTQEQIRDWYVHKVHNRYESNFGPYFRLIYTILHIIREDAILSDKEKARYGNILRSQLTSYELVIHGLNGLATFSKDFASLVTSFRLLKYLPQGDARRNLLERFYPLEAFQARD